MTTARYIDENGFMLIKGCPISSFGIFDYGAGQLGLPGDPNRIVKVFRPESAINNAETMNSFKDLPFIDDHEMLSGHDGDEEATAPEDYGIDGVMTSSVYYDQPWLRGDLKIFSRKMQRVLRQGKKDVSLGYSCDFEMSPGEWNGQAYEVVQTNMRGNHIALVDEGRVPGAKVLDGRKIFDHLNFNVRPSTSEDSQMAKVAQNKARKTAKDNAVQQLQALLPALQKFLSEEASEPEHADGEGEHSDPTAGGGESDPATAIEGGEADPSEGGNEADPSAGGGEVDPSAGGGEGGETEGGDLSKLIAEVEAVLAKLKASLGGAASDEGEGEGEDEHEGEHEGEDKIEGLDPTVDEEMEHEGEAKDEGEAEVGQGKASAGPAAGKHSGANDSSLRRFYADSARKDRLIDRLKPLVGAFNHRGMDASEVALYGLKKLKLKAKAGSEHIVLDAYLTGIEAANRRTRNAVQNTTNRASDSKVSSTELDAYLDGSK